MGIRKTMLFNAVLLMMMGIVQANALEIGMENFPQVGVKVIVEVDTLPAGIDVSPLTRSGVNQHWDFDWPLTPAATETLQVVLPENTPYASLFLDADRVFLSGVERLYLPVTKPILDTPVDTLIQPIGYLAFEGNQIYGLGMELVIPPYFQNAIRFNEKALFYDMPLHAGKSWTSVWEADTVLVKTLFNIEVPFPVTVRDSTRTEVDAEGQLTLHNQTFSCLRLKSVWKRRTFVQVEEDQIEIDAFGDARIIYRWFVPDIGVVLEIRSQRSEDQHQFARAAQIVKAAAIETLNGCIECEAPMALQLPETMVLSQNFPNPFNQATQIHFQLPKEGLVNLKVFNVLGHQITALIHNEFLPRGQHTGVWTGRDGYGQTAPSGVYFYQLSVQPPGGPEQLMTGKMILNQ